MRWNILQAYCRRPSSTLTSGGARYCTGYQEAFEQVLESLMAGGDDLVESDGDEDVDMEAPAASSGWGGAPIPPHQPAGAPPIADVPAQLGGSHLEKMRG